VTVVELQRRGLRAGRTVEPASEVAYQHTDHSGKLGGAADDACTRDAVDR
jgi:hypothetical protein